MNDSTTSTGTLSFSLESNVSHGSLLFTNTGSFTYTPNANYSGSDSFTYTVTDSKTSQTNSQTVILSVVTINDAPVASNYVVSPITEQMASTTKSRTVLLERLQRNLPALK